MLGRCDKNLLRDTVLRQWLIRYKATAVKSHSVV